ncbi:hypothetical protein EYR38_005404 [Pleurotus pulmonarius]|nr:hypothetical protein EYR38_005404 [Pleurotus pulmonarius]
MWWMQVQLLTHTIAQVYTSSQWRDSISKIDKDIRGFKVGMALDFGDYVGTRPEWAEHSEDNRNERIKQGGYNVGRGTGKRGK